MARSTRTTTRKTTGKRAERAAESTGTREQDGYPSHDEIQRRAYDIFISRGGVAGRDFDDWLQAERELADERRHRAAS